MSSIPPSADGPVATAIRSARGPAPWLVVLLAAVLVGGWVTGRAVPDRVADSQSYMNTANASSLDAALASYRTVGYPIFLRILRDDRPRYEVAYRRVPAAQQILFAASVVLFWSALSAFTRAPWLAFAGAAPLAFAPIWLLARNLQPDFLAGGFILVSFALLMLLSMRPSAALWTALTLAVFVSYQLRPAGFFLVVLIPAVGAIFRWLRERAPVAAALRFGGALALATLLPYLAFSALRWATVGHFGLVSFGGCNAAGMAACFIDAEVVDALPEPQSETAFRILSVRERRGWRPMTANDDPADWFPQYSDNIFHVSMRVVQDQQRREQLAALDPGEERPARLPPLAQVETNRRLAELSRAVVGMRRGLYVSWFGAALVYGARQLDDWRAVRWPFLALVLSVPALIYRPRRPWRPPADDDDVVRQRALAAMVILALAYFVTYQLTIALVSFPFSRYFASTVLLLPTALCMLIFEIWRSVLGARSARPVG